jgi:putative ABC transport system permease protein
MSYSLRGDKYDKDGAVREFGRRFVENVRSLPGVNAVAISNTLPPDQTDFSDVFYIEGRPAPKQPDIAYYSLISPEYFKALEIPLRRGRGLTDADTENAPLVCLVNETFQRSFFGTEDPLRRRINVGSPDKPNWIEIVGVVADVKYNGVTEAVQPFIYLAVAQSPTSGGFLVVKTTHEDPTSLIGPIRNELKNLDPDLPVTNVGTLKDQVSDRLAEPRFRTGLITLFAVIALLLACVGVYGVISYSVTQRTHEIGIRMAVGARASDVLGMIVKQAIYMAVLGVVVGLSISFFVVSLMVKLLFNVTPRDPIIFVAAALVLASTALIASYIPARRASKLDPLVALRSE